MLAILRQTAISTAIAFVILAALALLGWPTQKIADAGLWLHVRLLNLNKPAQPIGGGQTTDPKNGGEVKAEEVIEVTLPAALYGVESVPFSLDFDNLVLSKDSEAYLFSVTGEGAKGYTVGRHRWTASAPTPGESEIAVAVSDPTTAKLSEASTIFKVAPKDAGVGAKIRILVLGDSMTRQNWWVNHLARLLSGSGNPEWSMIGRSYEEGYNPPFAENTLPGVRHEGEYGWSFSFFSSLNTPGQAAVYQREKSPLIFLNAAGAPELDVARYYAEEAGGEPADIVIFQMGINDIWGVDATDPVLLEERMKLTLANADKLLAAFKKANPDTQMGLMLPAPFTRSDRTFKTSYGETISRWSARVAQHALVKAMIGHFGNREEEGIWLIPLYASFDTFGGYPVDNAGHPNESGHKVMAATAYAWIKWMLHART